MSQHIEAAGQVQAAVGDRRAGEAIALTLGAIAAFLIVVGVFWTGPLGSDDSLYWDASSGWLRHFPYLGKSHWSLRHTLVIPLALTRLALGDGLPALVLPTLLAALALIAVLVVWTWRVSDRWATIIAIALLVTNPLLVMLSSAVWIDPIEILFIFAGFTLIAGAMDNGPSWLPLLSAGALAGLALMSRETTVFALAAVGLLFLAGYGMERRWYLVIGLGFVAVAGSEALIYWAVAGDPLYRSTIAIHHDSTINRWVAQGSGTPILHPLIDPVIMLLLSHYYGLMFWIGIPLAVWLVVRGRLSVPARHLAILLGVLSLVWAVGVASLWQLLPLLPRYYLPPVLAVSILAALAVRHLWQQGRVRLALVCAVLLLVGNFLGLAAENHNFMYGEHVLVALAGTTDATIHTDPQTQRRADLMLQLRGVEDRVVTSAPKSGELFFYNPTRVEAGFRPPKEWTVVDRRAPPPSFVQRVLRLLPASLPIPSGLMEKLGPGHPGVILYRTD